MKRKQNVTDAIWMFVIYILLLMVTLLVPVISLISVFLLPIPFLIYGSKYSIREYIPLVTGALVFSVLIFPVFTLPATLIAASMGLLIGYAIREKSTPYETIVRGAIGFIIGLILAIVVSQSLFEINWISAMENQIDNSIEQSSQLLKDVGMERTKDQTVLLKEQMTAVKDMLPATIMIVGIILVALIQWIGYKVLNRNREDKLRFPALRTLRVPVFVMGIYLVVMVLALLNLEQGGLPYLIVNNLFTMLAFFILLHGISFIFYFAYAKKIPKFIPILILIFVVISPVVLLFTRLLGVIDIFLRLRDRIKVKK